MASDGGQSASIADRAADLLAVNYPGAHATKRIARTFRVGVSTAKQLRAGRHWTVQRLDQAEGIFGTPFREAMWPRPTEGGGGELVQIRRQLDELTGRGK